MIKTGKNFCLLGIFAFVFIFHASLFAKDDWVKIRSKNFNIIGNAPEKDVRKVGAKLEQFRETFRLVFPKVRLNAAIPTNVVVFKSASSYNQFKPKRGDGKIDKGIAGYFQPNEDVNYITLSVEGEDADTYGTIFHEYVHFMVDTTFGKSDVPPWFNEGLAEFYQTFEVEEDQKVKLGLAQSNHIYLLQQNKLMPFSDFFKVTNYSLHESGGHSRSIFYAQAWALVHYLTYTGKSAGMGKFLDLTLKKVPEEKAFQDAFQMTYEQMEKELRKYVSQNSYKYQIITLKNKLTFDNEMQSAAMSEAESNAYLGDLLYRIRRYEDAEPFLQKAIALEPQMSMANTTFGMVKIRQRKFADAKNYLDKAISQDQKNHFALYQYAFLLSRESYDDFGYVSSFPAEKAQKMRELLSKAIAVNPAYTESYELLAFVSLVNNEKLDEAVAHLRKALQYQPGNQRYIIRLAEIYSRQEKFADALAIAQKISTTTDDDNVKAQAEGLINRVRQMQEMSDYNAKSKRDFEEKIAQAKKDGAVVIVQSAEETPISEAELAKINEETQMRSLNEAVRKAGNNEKQVLGQIQKIECKGKNITYTIKTDSETFTLSSDGFENLALVTFLADSEGAEMRCGANLSAFKSVLTFKNPPTAKSASRGELIAVDFVPNSFRFVDLSKPAPSIARINERNEIEPITESQATAIQNPPPPDEKSVKDYEAMRREAMLKNIREAIYKPQSGEKQHLGFIEKIECGNKGMTFFFKTAAQPQSVKLTATSPQSIKIKAFTPELQSVQMGCGLKDLDIPVIFTYRDSAEKKSAGELFMMEFVPKSFTMQ